MIRKEENLELGVIAKPHGTRGSLLIRLRNIKAAEIKKRDWLFVETDGLLVPFLIEEFRANAEDSIIVKLSLIVSEKDAREISGCAVYISKDSIKKGKKTISNLESLEGYRVKDLNRGYVGIAMEISGVSANPLLRVSHENGEWLIPVHEDIIIEINDKKREITIEAPDGLFEL